ncbi:MAG: phosphohydrolase [Micavibrio sp.]|nr:phosphohydrolase [Micavibrio sp.]
MQKSIDVSDWPTNFDFAQDEICQHTFKPFIESELKLLEEYDAQRPKDTNYIFHKHAPRVAEDVRDTCAHLGLAPHICENMYWALLPHDIGKRKLPLYLWDMKDKPTDDIRQLRRSHTDIGAEMVEKKFTDIDHPFKDLLIAIIHHHHEQMDGNGYLGLTGDQLSMPVRLAAIVESFDGYRVWRPHFGDRDISVEGVLKRMRNEKGASHYDMDLFEAFASMKLAQKSPSPKKSQPLRISPDQRRQDP